MTSPAASTTPFAPGARLGPYEILAAIGAGGMGEVYRARDTRLGREVAVKVIAFYASSDPDRLRRFEQEARAVAALSHPSILSVYDVGTEAGAPYVVFELLEGESLGRPPLRRPEAVFARPGPRPQRRAAALAGRALPGVHVVRSGPLRGLRPGFSSSGREGTLLDGGCVAAPMAGGWS